MKDVAHEKKERYNTGGGPSTNEASQSSHLITSLCNDVLQPLSNDVDDDAMYHRHPEQSQQQPQSSTSASTHVHEASVSMQVSEASTKTFSGDSSEEEQLEAKSSIQPIKPTIQSPN